MLESAFEMCVNKPKGKIYILLINVLVWHLQPNTLSRHKLLSVDIIFLKKQLGLMLRKGQCESWFRNQQAFKERWSVRMCKPCEKSIFNRWKTVGHIPREISHNVYYFIKTGCGFYLVDWKFRCCLHCRAQNRRRLKKWKTLLILFMITKRVELTMQKTVMKKKLVIVVETDQSKPISR